MNEVGSCDFAVVDAVESSSLRIRLQRKKTREMGGGMEGKVKEASSYII